MNNDELANKMKLHYAGDNLPRLIETIIVGMPIRFSGDQKQLLEFANEVIQAEILRRQNSGRPKKWASIQEKNKHFNDKRRGKLPQSPE